MSGGGISPPGSEGVEPLIAVDLVDVVEDSWPQKRVWLRDTLALDPGPAARSRAWVEAWSAARRGVDGFALYESMSAEVDAPACVRARPPVFGAVRGLARLSRLARIGILSGRPESSRRETEAWLRAHGLDWLCGPRLAMLDAQALPGAGGPRILKANWCVQNGALGLIDSQAAHLAPVAETEGLGRIIFTRDETEQARCDGEVLVARSWIDVPRLVRRLARGLASAT